MKRWVDFIGGKMWLDPEASEFEALMAAGKWEHRKVALLQKYLKPGMVFVDAGAHWGYFSLIAAKMGAYVLAFEPCRDNHKICSQNAIESGFSNILLQHTALWNTEGYLEFYRGYNSGTHSLVKNYQGTINQTYVTRLDKAIQDYFLPDVMKVDVEGADVQVLEGASDILSGAVNMVILMDLHPELGVKNEYVGELLHAHGFHLYDIRSNNAPIETIPPTMVELLALKGYDA